MAALEQVKRAVERRRSLLLLSAIYQQGRCDAVNAIGDNHNNHHRQTRIKQRGR
jgi:hypothetical protein